MTRAFLGMGSNLGERRRYLREAVDTLGEQVVAVSSMYETEPVGGPPAQDDYLNVVVQLETELEPRPLLAVCHRLESAAGRVRDIRWGPRTLDVDILWIDGVTMTSQDLVIPHPRLFKRRFVLVPLGELAPELLPANWEDDAEGQITGIHPW